MNNRITAKVESEITFPEFNSFLNNSKKVFDLLDVSDTTRDDYKNRIGLFVTFSQERGMNRNIFLDFKRYLTERTDFSVSTKNKYLATAKIFLKELNRQGALPADITQNIKSFSQSKKHKRDGLNEEEMQTLTSVIKGLEISPKNSRIKALLSLLALQGLRQIEISRLDVQDLDFVANVAYIQGKGRDDKEPINLHPDTVQALKEYMKLNKVKAGALFVSNSNNNKNKRMTTRSIRLIVKNVLTELGIEKSTHGFRHYFTTRLIKTYKGDLLEVAQYTRHRSLEMLQVYNDRIKQQADLPRFYGAFEGVSF